MDFAKLRCRAIDLGIDSITRYPGMIMIGHHDRERIDALRQAAAKKGRVVRVVDQKRPSFLPARPITPADLAALTERERQGLEHLLRFFARPPFALERLSVTRGPDGRATSVRYVLPKHWVIIWAGNWVGRGRKSTRPGANGVVELSPFQFLDRLADLIPAPRKHRHRYHGVFALNHKLPKAVTTLAIGKVGTQTRGNGQRAWKRRSRHRRLPRHSCKAPFA